jgi:tetratricopeptide (TPR) repeat protein
MEILTDRIATEMKFTARIGIGTLAALVIALRLFSRLVKHQAAEEVNAQRVVDELLRRTKQIVASPRIAIALAAVGVLLAALAGWFVYKVSAPPSCTPGTTCVVVARFSPPDESLADSITRDIYQQLNGLLDPDDFSIIIGPTVESAQQARSLAEQQDAVLVVWGSVFSEADKLRIYFELTDLLGLENASTMRPLRSVPLEYAAIDGMIECANCMDLLGDVTQRATMVAYATSGMAHYAQGKPERARFDFMNALWCSGEPEPLGQDDPADSPCAAFGHQESAHADLLYYYIGKALALAGDFQAGLAALQEAAARNPLDPAVQIAIGSLYQEWLNAPRAPEAMQALQAAHTAASQLHQSIQSGDANFAATVLFEEGLAQELQGKDQAALDVYQDGVRRLAENDPSAYLLLLAVARVQTKLHAESDAITTLKRATELVPAAPWAFIELANLLRQDVEQAQRYLDEAGSKQYGQFNVHVAQAELCASNAEHECAQKAYQDALQLRPDSSWLHGQIGQYYEPTANPQPHHSWSQAEVYYRNAAELRAGDPWAHERLAYVLLNQDKFDSSIAEYDAAIRLMHPGHIPSGVYCNLGFAQQESYLIDEAAASYQRCISTARTPSEKEKAQAMLAALPRTTKTLNVR